MITQNEKLARCLRNIEEVTAWDIEVFYTARYGRLEGPLAGLMQEEAFKDQIKAFKEEIAEIARKNPGAIPSFLLNGDKFDVIVSFVAQIHEFIKMILSTPLEELEVILTEELDKRRVEEKKPTIH